jgi:hypothetical protein
VSDNARAKDCPNDPAWGRTHKSANCGKGKSGEAEKPERNRDRASNFAPHTIRITCLSCLSQERSKAGQELTTGVISQTDPLPDLDSLEQKRNSVLLMFQNRETGMLRIFVEEAAALASIALFVGMIAVWAQLIPQL